MNILKQAKKLWMGFAHTIGRVNTFILLTVFYLIVIGLIALLKRIVMIFKPTQIGWKKKEPWEPTADWASRQF